MKAVPTRCCFLICAYNPLRLNNSEVKTRTGPFAVAVTGELHPTCLPNYTSIHL